MKSKLFLLFFILVFSGGVQSATLLESSFSYLMSLGKNFAPSFLSMIDCVGGDDTWGCVREKAGKMLDGWEDQVEKERKSWEEEADSEIRQSGRSIAEMPSKIGREITDTFGSLSNIIEKSLARSLESGKKHGGGGIDSITISAGNDKKKKTKKQKPPKIHLIQVPMRKVQKEEKGRSFGSGVQSWVIGERALPVNLTSDDESQDETKSMTDDAENPDTSMIAESNDENADTGMMTQSNDENRDSSMMTESMVEQRGYLSDLWSMGKEAVDSLAETIVENEDKENGLEDRSSLEEQRGKKKKKKKAILKLLILGAVIKAKIGTLLQILTYKLQIKFFIVAVLGLAINLARLWIDLKNKNQHQPQKIIYYEHAQHQHHYDHEEEEASHGWGPWSRSILPDDSDVDASEVSPYKAQEQNPLVYNQYNPYSRS